MRYTQKVGGTHNDKDIIDREGKRELTNWTGQILPVVPLIPELSLDPILTYGLKKLLKSTSSYRIAEIRN